MSLGADERQELVREGRLLQDLMVVVRTSRDRLPVELLDAVLRGTATVPGQRTAGPS